MGPYHENPSDYQLVVIAGPARGLVLPVPDEGLELGRFMRDAEALAADAALSRRHARVGMTADGGLYVMDLASTNGTFVDGRRVTGERVLAEGQQLQLGDTVFEIRRTGGQEPVGRADPPRWVNPPERSGSRGTRVPVGRTLLIAGGCALVPLVGNVAASFLTEWTGVGSWLVVPAVGVVVAIAIALIQAYGSAGGEASQYPTAPPSEYRSTGLYQDRPARDRGAPLPVVLLVSFLVIGLGGLGIVAGIRYGVGYITGNESGTDRLVEQRTASANGLVLTVESVVETDHFTRVGVAVRNGSRSSLSLPLFGNCFLISGDGYSLEADAFRSRWSITFAPGILQRGTILFTGHMPGLAKQASLTFAQIFGPGGGAITVSFKLQREER